MNRVRAAASAASGLALSAGALVVPLVASSETPTTQERATRQVTPREGECAATVYRSRGARLDGQLMRAGASTPREAVERAFPKVDASRLQESSDSTATLVWLERWEDGRLVQWFEVREFNGSGWAVVQASTSTANCPSTSGYDPDRAFG